MSKTTLKETFEWPKFHFQNVYDILTHITNNFLNYVQKKETHNSFIKLAALVFSKKKENKTRLQAFTLTDIYRQKGCLSRSV